MSEDRGAPLGPRGMEWVIAIAIITMTVGLRAYQLSEWSLSDDEYWSWRDSVAFPWARVRMRPLYFALNHFLVRQFIDMRELGLRLVPLVAGVAVVPTVYLLLRRLRSPLLAVSSASLVAVSAWHVYWSQFARYYTHVFLFSAVFAVCIVGALRERRSQWVWSAAISALLAVLAHPSALIVVGFGALLAAALLVRRSNLSARRWPWLVAPLVLAAVAGARYLPLLQSWATYSESQCCHRGVDLLLSLANWMTAPVIVCALAGMVMWMLSADRRVGVFVTACALGPTAVFWILSQFMPISLSYLFGTAPFYLLAAGWIVAKAASLGGSLTERRLLFGALLVALMAGNTVGLASHYRDGGRLPYRTALQTLDSLIQDGDDIVMEGTGFLQFYAPRLEGRELPRDSVSLGEVVGEGGRTWVLAPRVDRAGYGYYERQFDSVYRWLEQRCELVTTFGTPRLDFRRNLLELYSC